MSRRVRITSKLREEPDLDQLVLALVRIVKQKQAKPAPKDESVKPDEESAA